MENREKLVKIPFFNKILENFGRRRRPKAKIPPSFPPLKTKSFPPLEGLKTTPPPGKKFPDPPPDGRPLAHLWA